MCGIVGIYSQEPVAASLLDSMIHLQHRGQDAAGILTCDQRFYSRQGLGLVREIFSEKDIDALRGTMGIAHARYPTSGGYSEQDIQPLWIGSPRGIALAHNGNLTNYQELAEDIRHRQHRHLNSTLDSEVLLLMLADALAHGNFGEDDEAFFELLCHAVTLIHQRIEGAYSVVSVIIGKGLVVFRDPNGIRPLVYGTKPNASGGEDMIFASETTPFYALGFEAQQDIQPGEVAFVSQKTGKLHRRILSKAPFRPCVFEYVYFARPDAVLNQVSVYRSRLRMGQNLSRQWREQYPDLLPDVVIPVPFTSNTAAMAFAHELGVRYTEGLYKNPFIGRTFIMPNQKTRKRNIAYKLSPQRTEIANKSILLVDDSIVRGTTSREIVKMVRELGAKKVYMVSASPEIKYPCFYGIDMPSPSELIAASKTCDEIAHEIGVDILMFQSQENLVEAVTRRGKNGIEKPCMACMDGLYVCKTMSGSRMQQLEKARQLDREIEEEPV